MTAYSHDPYLHCRCAPTCQQDVYGCERPTSRVRNSRLPRSGAANTEGRRIVCAFLIVKLTILTAFRTERNVSTVCRNLLRKHSQYAQFGQHPRSPSTASCGRRATLFRRFLALLSSVISAKFTDAGRRIAVSSLARTRTVGNSTRQRSRVKTVRQHSTSYWKRVITIRVISQRNCRAPQRGAGIQGCPRRSEDGPVGRRVVVWPECCKNGLLQGLLHTAFALPRRY